MIMIIICKSAEARSLAKIHLGPLLLANTHAAEEPEEAPLGTSESAFGEVPVDLGNFTSQDFVISLRSFWADSSSPQSPQYFWSFTRENISLLNLCNSPQNLHNNCAEKR